MKRTRALAEWVVATKYRDFPEETATFAKSLLLKTVTGMLVGSREPIAKILLTYLSGKGGAPEAGVVGGGFRTTVENAALANATFAHCSELEDNELPNITSAYWMFPALFPLAEKQVSSGREVIEAAVISWEVASRFCRAASGWQLMMVHICPPTWFGPLGVAAAGAKLLKLTPTETEHALSIAGSYACGLGQAGADAHFLESGHTSQMGLQAAILAKAGATGELGVLELPYGLYAPVWSKGNVDLDIIDGDLGIAPYLINQACIKKYSACTFSHTSIDALALLMKENGVAYDEVEYVETLVSKLAHGAVGTHPQVADLQEARFSLEYLLAEVLLKGRVDVHSFEGEEKLSDPAHKEAEKKVRVGLLPDAPFESRSAQVTIVKKNGDRLVQRLDEWIGSPLHPLTLEQIREVCRPYLEIMLPGPQCDRVEELVLNLEKQPDLLELMDILTFSRVGHRAR